MRHDTIEDLLFDAFEEVEKAIRLGLRIVGLAVGVGRVVRVDYLCHFDQNIVLVVLVERVDSLLVHVSDHVHGREIHVLNGLHDVGELTLRSLQHLQHVVEAGTGDYGDVSALGLDGAQKCALSNHSKSSFGADKQVLQVRSCVVLPQSCHIVQDGSICEHRGQTDTIRMQ